MTQPYEPRHAAPDDGYGVSGRPYSAPAGEAPPWEDHVQVQGGAGPQFVDCAFTGWAAEARAGYDGPGNVPWPNTLPSPADRNPDGSPSWVPFGPEADRRRAENDEYARQVEIGGDGGGGWSTHYATQRFLASDPPPPGFGEPYHGDGGGGSGGNLAWSTRRKVWTAAAALVAAVVLLAVVAVLIWAPVR